MCYVFHSIAMTSLCWNNHIDRLWSQLDDGNNYKVYI